MSEIEIKFDYFSATFPLACNNDDDVLYKVEETVHEVRRFLNVKEHEYLKSTYAQNNFKHQYILGESMILRLDGPINSDYHRTCQLELKGEGCREFESRNKDKTWLDLIFFMYELHAKFKRIDIAIDDFSGDKITIPYILRKLEKGYYSSRFKSKPLPHGTEDLGLTIQFGSHKSPIQLVIYDKLKERQKAHKEVDKDYWCRYEMRFKNHYADFITLDLIDNFKNRDEPGNGFKLNEFAFSKLYSLLDLKKDNNYDSKSQHKVETEPKWMDFLENVSKGSIVNIKGNDTANLDTYMKNAGPYIYTYLLFLYQKVNHYPDLFILEIYKFLCQNMELSKRRFQRLNMLLASINLPPIDDNALALIKSKFKKNLEEMEMPF